MNWQDRYNQLYDQVHALHRDLNDLAHVASSRERDAFADAADMTKHILERQTQ